MSLSRPLPLRVAPAPRETVQSFFGRMAAANGSATSDFSRDLRLPFVKFHSMDVSAVSALGVLADLTTSRMREMISWSGSPLNDSRMAFRGEETINRALRTPAVRGCPKCLLEDIEGKDGPPEKFMALRGNWLLRTVRVCLKHCHPLVKLWASGKVAERYDVQLRMREIAPAILNSDLDRPLITITPYDTWLDDRLENGRDETWLLNVSVHAATTFCGLLGTELLRTGIAAQGGDDPRVVGFDVARLGREAIAMSLDELFLASPGATDKLKTVYGELYRQLRWAHVDDEAFAPFLGLMRDHVLARWPVAAGEAVVGKPLKDRQRHSVRSAALETRLTEVLMQRILISKGAINPDDPLPPARNTFDARDYTAFLERLPRLVGRMRMMRMCGMTRDQFTAVVDAGMLKPAIDPAIAKRSWDPESGYALLRGILGDAPTVQVGDGAWMSLSAAAARRRLPLLHLYIALRDGRLKIAKVAGLNGFDAIRVLPREVDRVFPPPERTKTTVAEFARSVGVRDAAAFQQLIKDGHIDAIKVPNLRTGRVDLCFEQAQIISFRKRFETLYELARGNGKHMRTARTDLTSAGIEPVSLSGRTYDWLYYRITTKNIT